MSRSRRSFGAIRKRSSGRFQASFTGPDLVRHFAPSTFQTKMDAEAWLVARHAEISGSDWKPPVKPVTFEDYSRTWLAARDLKPRTRVLYRQMIDTWLLPTFGRMPLRAISPDAVRQWYANLPADQRTLRANAYSLLRTVLGTAATDELISNNPCRIRGAGSKKRSKVIKPLTVPQVAALVEAMPAKYRLLTLMAAWCGLRFGELTELRVKDVNLDRGMLHVRRAVVRVEGSRVVSTPKSLAGARDVSVPPHLLSGLAERLSEIPGGSREGLLFPASDGISHLAESTVYRQFKQAREAIDRSDLRWHDLRHTGAVLAAAAGASVVELMARLGHTTPTMAMRYQHVAEGRDTQLAAAMSKLAEGI